MIAAVLSDFGIVRLFEFMVEEHIRAGRLVEALPEWNHRSWPAYLYAPTRSHCSPGVQAFKDFILSQPFDRTPRL